MLSSSLPPSLSFPQAQAPPLAPALPRPWPGCGPTPSSSDTHSMTPDMLKFVLLDFSWPLTSCASG